jgi:hypothetical protein
MPKKKKLTAKLREQIKKDYRKLKKSDFDGDALAYLNRVRGAAKGRKAKKEKVAEFDGLKLPEDSEIYRIVAAGAKLKKQSVKKFVKENRKNLEALLKDGDFVQQRETEYLIRDIQALPKSKKVFVNDGNGYTSTPKLKDILAIQLFTQHVASYSNIFLLVYRVHYKLGGDLSHYLPSVEEYEPLEDEQEIIDLLDDYYPEITYLISRKRSETQTDTEPKIIEPDAPERKKGRKKKAGKSKSVHRRKR